MTVDVPEAAGIDEPFYPQSLERGRRSSRAVMLAIAEMYVRGVSTRDAAKVMAEFGLKSLSSTQVSRAAALLDEVFTLPEQHWRRMRTANPIERAIQQEIKRRTSKVRVFPNRDALLRIATAVLVELDEDAQPRTASTSTGTARMPDRPNSESPDFRLLNPTKQQIRYWE